jgi:hypothetical protein
MSGDVSSYICVAWTSTEIEASDLEGMLLDACLLDRGHYTSRSWRRGLAVVPANAYHAVGDGFAFRVSYGARDGEPFPGDRERGRPEKAFLACSGPPRGECRRALVADTFCRLGRFVPRDSDRNVASSGSQLTV